MLIFNFLFKICFLSLFVFSNCKNIVKITDGLLNGTLRLTRFNKYYYEFTKIPYAEPPIGALRFQPPQPPKPWNGIRQSTKPTPFCIQNIKFNTANMHIMGDEDCLYLDVYTPANISKPLPVMVFIHGGALKGGSASMFHPLYFMDYDIIMVQMQYRLHVLGFLSMNDEIIPGNLGMKDQVAALKWIKNNIAAFGGNPNSVTLFGSSSGAFATHIHIFSPLSKGLFHRIICQSGTAFFPTVYSDAEHVRKRTIAFAEILQCPTQSSEKIMQCLQQLPAEYLVHTHEKMYMWNSQPAVVFPVVNEHEHPNAFITQPPLIPVTNVPMITGINKCEGVFYVAVLMYNNGEDFRRTIQTFDYSLPRTFGYHLWLNDDQISITTEALKNYYFRNKDFKMDITDELIDLYTDGFFTMKMLKAAKIHKETVYLYFFDHHNEHSYTELLNFRYNGSNQCISHVDEMLNLFYLPAANFSKMMHGPDSHVSKKMLDYWINFAYKGNPNGENELWKPMKTDNFEYLHITTFKDEMKKGIGRNSYEFWTKLNILHPVNKKSASTFLDEL